MLEGRQPGDAGLLRRVRWRLVAWSAGSTLLLLLLLGSALYFSVETSLAAAGTAQLDRQIDSLGEFASRQPPDRFRRGRGAGRDDSPFGRAIFGGPGSGTLAIAVDTEGDIVGPRPADPEGMPIRDGVEAALSGGRDVRNSSIGDTPVRVVSQRIEVGEELYVIQVAQDRTAEQRTLRTVLLVLVLGGLVVLGAATAFGFLYAGRALVPIQDSLRRQREFAADASHELRTPLAVVRGSVEHLRRNPDRPVREVGAALDDIDSEVGHLTALVDDLLLLARSDSGAVELRREPVDLAETVGEALSALRGLADGRGARLRLDAAPVTVRGDPDRLRQLVTILVDNAIRHSPAGGTVRVSVRHGTPAVVAVEDDGPGIRAEDFPRVFERFWRAADAPAGGTGLGLSIARWIAEHHGGSISVANRRTGGARFEVRLPSA